jgi:hypothetical protein
MNVTIVKEDRVVMVDGHTLNFDFTMADNIWAIQWNGSVGEVEYNDGTPNLELDTFSEYQYVVDAYTQEKQRLEIEIAQADSDRIANITYADKRAEEYPEVVDQLDDIFHNGIEGWKVTIQGIKDKYPK